MVIYSCAWPLLLNTIGAVKQVDPLLIKSARTMGATPQQLFRKVILPAALPTIFVGIRLASASAMLVLVASEMVGAKAGLGLSHHQQPIQLPIPQMYFGILGITVIGLAFNCRSGGAGASVHEVEGASDGVSLPAPVPTHATMSPDAIPDCYLFRLEE